MTAAGQQWQQQHGWQQQAPAAALQLRGVQLHLRQSAFWQQPLLLSVLLLAAP
jgi:hypothetical protein